MRVYDEPVLERVEKERNSTSRESDLGKRCECRMSRIQIEFKTRVRVQAERDTLARDASV